MIEADVAVVGAGPAGVVAALAAAGSGARTVLIDEQAAVGGHLRWDVAPLRVTGELDGMPGVRAAVLLADRVGRSGVGLLLNTIAWGLFEGNVLGLAGPGGSSELQARAVVVAAGSTDIVDPFPGSTLPGVMTSRAIQIFLHLHRVLPGRRFAVLGAGPDAESVARAIGLAGTEVVARVERLDAVRVLGDDRVRQIAIDGQSMAVDVVAIALGRQPDPQLALQAQVRSTFSFGAGGWVPLRSAWLETSVPGVYVAGEAAGIIDVAEALAEGELAGLAAARAPEGAREAARERLVRLRGAERATLVEELRLGGATA